MRIRYIVPWVKKTRSPRKTYWSKQLHESDFFLKIQEVMWMK